VRSKKKLGGYSYTLTKEQIEWFKSLSIEERLNWLEEANRFLWSAMSEKAKKIREKVRRGDI